MICQIRKVLQLWEPHKQEIETNKYMVLLRSQNMDVEEGLSRDEVTGADWDQIV